MPGIAGIISKTPGAKKQKEMAVMLDSMRHESFYVSDSYGNEQYGVYAGWVCHQDSFCDCMPVWNERKNVLIIFFGEDFTDPEVLNNLKTKNHCFEHSNASYLIHMYEEKGIDFLQDLNGWFSGLLIDLQTNKIVLFNDRYGMQKIFYHEDRDAFYFSSEAKAILKVCPESRTLDMRGLGELLSCGCVLENRTLFKDVFLLPTAAAWTFENGCIPSKGNYFNPNSWEKQSQIKKDQFYDHLKDTFRKILPRYFRSNQKIGISLTAGLDTRMIMANAPMPPGEYPCFTFGGMYRDCYDVTVAQKVAKVCHQTHQIIPLDATFLKNFDQYAARTIYITDGCLDLNGAPEIYVNRIAREIAPVRLTGNFGGEVIRNIRHLGASSINEMIFQPEFNELIKHSKETLNKITRNAPLSFILFNDAPWLANKRFVAEQSQLTLRSPYLDNDLTALMYRAPHEIVNNEDTSLKLISDGNAKLGKILSDRGVLGKTAPLHAKMVRTYREFFFLAEYVYNYGMPQWLARFDYTFKFMHFEKLFLGRHKYYHYRLWFRDELANYVKAILLDSKTLNRPYLNRKAVEEIVECHTKGHRNYTTEIHHLLHMELIQRQLIEM